MDPGARNSSRPYHSRFEPPRVPVPRRVGESQDNHYPLIDPRSKVNAGELDQTSTKSFRLDAIFRSFGLGIIYDKLKKDEKEHPKVAIWNSRTVALPRLLFHIIPVGGAIALLWLNLIGYYLGTEIPGIEGHNSAKIGALQFAAKMHEITILASLSIIVFNLIQDRIVTHDVALSVLFAGLQFRDLSYIWSKELWQLVGSEWRRWKSFIPVLFLAVLLASTVAPSSALLMVPRSDEYAAGGTEFWLNATRDELWPSEVTIEGIGVDPSCLEDPDPLYCPSSGWDSFASQTLPFFRNTALPGSPYNYISNPDSAPIPGKYGSRDLKLRVGVRGELGIGWTIAACPTRVLADALAVTSMFWDYASFCPPEREHFSWRESATWAISGLRQATTTVSCFASQDGKIRVPLVEPSEGAAITYPSEIMNVTNMFWVQQVSKMSRSPRPELLWLELNHTKLGANSLGAIATIPNKDEGGNIVIGCEIDPRWVDSKYDIKHSQIPDIRLTTWIAEPEDYSNVNVYHAIPPRIKVSPGWAEYLNPVISSMNQTAFENMMIMTGQWKSGIFYDETERMRESVETIIAGMVSNGLSNTSPSTVLQGGRPADTSCLPEWYKPLMPQRSWKSPGIFGKGGMFWNMTGIDTSHMTKFQMNASVKGYAYSSNGSTSIVAIVVLLIYCLMAIFHAVYICFTGRSSSSWESISDVAILAIQSQPTELLKNTGSGITTSGVFRSQVQIRDVQGRAELIFRGSSQESISIKRNKLYG